MMGKWKLQGCNEEKCNILMGNEQFFHVSQEKEKKKRREETRS